MPIASAISADGTSVTPSWGWHQPVVEQMHGLHRHRRGEILSSVDAMEEVSGTATATQKGGSPAGGGCG